MKSSPFLPPLLSFLPSSLVLLSDVSVNGVEETAAVTGG